MRIKKAPTIIFIGDISCNKFFNHFYLHEYHKSKNILRDGIIEIFGNSDP